MPDADLAAQIAAVRLDAGIYEAGPHKTALRAALRVLEALADRDAMGEIASGHASEIWDRLIQEPNREAWRRSGDRIVAALLARAGGAG